MHACIHNTHYIRMICIYTYMHTCIHTYIGCLQRDIDSLFYSRTCQTWRVPPKGMRACVFACAITSTYMNVCLPVPVCMYVPVGAVQTCQRACMYEDTFIPCVRASVHLCMDTRVS